MVDSRAYPPELATMRLEKLPHRPLVFAHRGASAVAQDNTVEAFRLAAAAGADGVELDVRLTADGAMVVHHDGAIPGLGFVAATTLGEIRERAPTVPTLDEAAEACGDLLIDIELKNDPAEAGFDGEHSVADAIAEWVMSAGMLEHAFVTSFNPDTLARVRSLSPRTVTGLLLDRSAHLEAELEMASAAGHSCILPHKRHLRSGPSAVVEAAATHGLGVLVWTVDRPGMQRRLSAAGVTGIICNDPGRALRRLA